MHLPLTQWTLHAENLPERLFDAPEKPAFSLPGASELSAFADLIGADVQQETEEKRKGVLYVPDGCFEDDLCGSLTLSKEIDFGACAGDRALLTFEELAGSGEILLGESCIARFGGGREEEIRHAYDLTGMPCALAVDVSEALRLGRRETLSLRFDAARPAGVMGAAFLSVSTRAHLSRVSIQPDTNRRTMTVRARISARQAGRYVLRVQAVPPGLGASLPPARETDVTLGREEERGIQLSLQVDAPVFVPGHAYDAPALKIQLFARSEKEKGSGLLCDDALLMCGYGSGAPGAYLPVNQTEDPQALCSSLADMSVFAVFLAAPAPDRLYRALTRAGVAIISHISEEIRPMFTRYPCLTLADAPLNEENASLEASAWQMAGSVAFPRAIDTAMTAQEMLWEASGRKLDKDDPGVRDSLAWLRAVQVRLRAEAARQGRYRGALCSAQESQREEIRDALKTAFSPVHLSALPLCGAWWTGVRFSAALEAYLPKDTENDIEALAILEDEDGGEVARFSSPCRRSGYLGVIEAVLPDKPCVLSLRCALLSGGKTIEESVLPVYVGERGVLESAF